MAARSTVERQLARSGSDLLDVSGWHATARSRSSAPASPAELSQSRSTETSLAGWLRELGRR